MAKAVKLTVVFILLICFGRYSVVAQPPFRSEEENCFPALSSGYFNEGNTRSWAWGFDFLSLQPFDWIPISSPGLNEQASPHTLSNQWQEILWLSRGPICIVDVFGQEYFSGRIRALAVHPQNPEILYIGAASGGLWKSEDGGGHWQDLSETLTRLTFGALAIDPAHPQVIYAGTGEPVAWWGNFYINGAGLFKSTDGGNNWQQITAGFGEMTAFGALAVSPYDSNLVLAGLCEGYSFARGLIKNTGIWRSSDGGYTWSRVLELFPETGSGVYDIIFHPQNPAVVYAAVSNSTWLDPKAGFYISADSGKTWIRSSEGLPEEISRMQIAVSHSNPDSIYALVYDPQFSPYRTRLYRSSDGGQFWEHIATETNFGSGSRDQGDYDLCLALDPQNPNHLLVGNILLRQSFDGETFGDPIPQLHVDVHKIVFAPTDNDIIYVATDGGLYLSTDGGLTWKDRNYGLSTVQFYGIAGNPENQDEILGGTQDNWVVMTKDGGETAWFHLPLGGDIYGTFYDPETPNVIYLTTGNSLWRSTDHGENFEDITPETTYKIPFNIREETFCIHPDSGGWLYIASDRIWRSTDYGDTWQAISDSLSAASVTAMAISPANPKILIVGTRVASYANETARILISTDGGFSWQESQEPLPENNITISRIVPHPTEENVFFVVRAGFRTPKIYKTIDLGQHWEDITGNLPDVPHRDFFVDPQKPELYLTGNDLGVYGSIDDGQTWYRVGSNFPYVPVTDFDYYSDGQNRLLRVATYGRGVYEINMEDLALLALPEPKEFVPSDFKIISVFPNPFNSKTRIRYSIKKAGMIQIRIYNVRGQMVHQAQQTHAAPGVFDYAWQADDLPSGVYFVQLSNGKLKVIEKCILQK